MRVNANIYLFKLNDNVVCNIKEESECHLIRMDYYYNDYDPVHDEVKYCLAVLFPAFRCVSMGFNSIPAVPICAVNFPLDAASNQLGAVLLYLLYELHLQ